MEAFQDNYFELSVCQMSIVPLGHGTEIQLVFVRSFAGSDPPRSAPLLEDFHFSLDFEFFL